MNSDQIDDDERGFTFRKRGPLDMRFDVRSSSSSYPSRSRGGGGEGEGDANGSVVRTAGDIVNGWSAARLSKIFRNYADEPYAMEIAHDIVRWRETLPWERGGIRSTLELRYVIEEAVEGIVSSSSNNATTSPKKDKEYGIGDGVHKKGETKRADDFRRYRAIWHPSSTRGGGRVSLSRQRTNKLLFKYKERRPRHANHVMRCFQALRIQSYDTTRK